MTSWIELEIILQKKKTIDESVQVAINKEREHWKQILKRIIAVVQRIAKNNLALRGDCEKLYVENNGIFLQLIEMIAEFDPIMEEHLRRVQERQIHYTYLGPKIQNELIQMLAAEVRNASHEEQMSLVIRCVDDSKNAIVVEEFWIGFLKVNETSGLGLFIELKNILSNLELAIDDIRGQGYDNGSNMKEKMDIDVAIGQLKGLISFLQEFRESGFDQALVEAEHIASEMGIEHIFREKRIIQRKRQFDDINSEEWTVVIQILISHIEFC
uniref:uncharacterized protein LOC124939314 n=1 Tax=Impatiens glandulifera TaxID=253017 RepID=UPI001FB09EED|nr:uncharacterized protein LOC124939314 [Impatiens glandulifera]